MRFRESGLRASVRKGCDTVSAISNEEVFFTFLQKYMDVELVSRYFKISRTLVVRKIRYGYFHLLSEGKISEEKKFEFKEKILNDKFGKEFFFEEMFSLMDNLSEEKRKLKNERMVYEIILGRKGCEKQVKLTCLKLNEIERKIEEIDKNPIFFF